MPDETTPAPAPDWEKFANNLDVLNQNLTGLRGDLQNGHQQVEEDPSPQDDPPSAIELPDFDSMSQKEMGQWFVQTFGVKMTERIIQQVTEQVTGIVKPVLERQNQAEQQILEDKRTREITGIIEAKGDDGRLLYPDFQDFIPEIIEIVKENPQISARRAYTLAKNENQKKAKELDTKYNPPPPPKPKPFSFTPGGSNTGADGKPAKPLDNAAAFRKAYEAVSARHPGVLPGLDA